MARTPRTPPKPPFYNAEPGICRGCGEELLTKGGERARNRRWCADCALGWRVASQPAIARAAVFMRDMGICHDCGEDCTSYEVSDAAVLSTYRVQINRGRALEWCERIMNKHSHRRQSLYKIDLGEWHVDHAMPLHLIDRSKPEAWREWTLPNLRTRCPSCHGDKTIQEAKDRGKVRRLNGTTKKKLGRKIPQRANPWPTKPRRDDDLPRVGPDKPWITETVSVGGPLTEAEEWNCEHGCQFDNKRVYIWGGSHYPCPIHGDASVPAVMYGLEEEQRRARIQAAHKNPPQRKPERNKLKGRGFGE